MSIKICVITPISHLEYSSLGEMDMSLTHLIAEDPGGDYARYYREQSDKGRFVILDNSAFELEQLGKGMDPDVVLDAAKVTNPSEVIATDTVLDGPATVESTKHFIERMKARGELGKYRVMAVPQGKTKEEWRSCFEKLFEIEEVDTIGLSKLSVPISWLGEKESSGNCARARLQCAEYIASELVAWGCYDEKGYWYNKPFHLLGGDNWTPWEMKQHIEKRHTFIRSNDSSCAVWYGAHGKVYDDEGKINDIIMEKPDLENERPETAEMLYRQDNLIDAPRCIVENIARWHMACK